LKKDPTLMAASFTIGRSCFWTIAALDQWMRARVLNGANAVSGENPSSAHQIGEEARPTSLRTAQLDWV
jgi:hypothetical protein